MGNRYDNRKLFKNREETFKKLFQKRGVKFVRHYDTARLMNPSRTVATFDTVQHIWKTGDRFYKLAGQYYNLPSYWWIIAQYNHKPTEAHVKLGEPIWIPVPLEAVVGYMN
tara:strand:+ start:127 stop:459 length:333 start_codon:yes stop_codon:yes gene_type:complete